MADTSTPNLTRNIAILLSALSGNKKKEADTPTPSNTEQNIYDKPLYNEFLVPINIHLNVDDFEINDSFIWNLKETYLTPEDFAQTFVDDLILPQKFKQIIADSIREQLSTYEKNLQLNEEEDNLSSDNNNQDSMIIDNSLLDVDEEVNNNEEEQQYCFPPPPPVYEIKKECLCIIQLHISIGQTTIQDQFEWDLNANERYNSPELFARVLCTDLGLSREFQVAIAHSIREQLLSYRKQLLDKAKGLSSPQYGGKENNDVFLSRPPILNPLRPLEENENWTPIVGPTDKLAELINARVVTHGSRSDTRYRLRSLGPRSSARNKIINL